MITLLVILSLPVLTRVFMNVVKVVFITGVVLYAIAREKFGCNK